MDDFLLFTPSTDSHIAKLKDLLKALLKNGLKISSMKCQLFRTNLQYMGNKYFIEDKRVCVKTIKKQIGSYTKAPSPEYSKRMQSFAEMVNFLSMFCPDLQNLLKPIYDLTRKADSLYGRRNSKIHLKK